LRTREALETGFVDFKESMGAFGVRNPGFGRIQGLFGERILKNPELSVETGFLDLEESSFVFGD